MLVDVYQRCFHLAHATEIAEHSPYNLGILVCPVVVLIPNRTTFELPYLCLCYGGHFRKQMYSICLCFQDYYYVGYVVCFVSVYTISCCLHPRPLFPFLPIPYPLPLSTPSTKASIYVIIFIFNVFTTFLLQHHNKG